MVLSRMNLLMMEVPSQAGLAWSTSINKEQRHHNYEECMICVCNVLIYIAED